MFFNKQQTQKIKELRVAIFPFPGVIFPDEMPIGDHLNLSGSSPSSIGFIPVTDLYLAKKNLLTKFEDGHIFYSSDSIIVACLKHGSKLLDDEIRHLKEIGVSAYSYDLLEPALYLARAGFTVNAIGYTPKLPQEFYCMGFHSGIKDSIEKLDLGIIHSTTPCVWTGVFTKNYTKAACVKSNIFKHENDESKIKTLVVNSGCANACTGTQGDLDNDELISMAAKFCESTIDTAASASTGLIGSYLPIPKIRNNLNEQDFNNMKAQDKEKSIQDFAEAILTTDTKIKLSQDPHNHILGFAKGSGMIAPNMATMLGFLVSDVTLKGYHPIKEKAKIKKAFNKILKEACEKSFNAISVDEETSTNDMVIFMSNLKGFEITEDVFRESMMHVCNDLAKKIIDDGEGATKVIDLKIHNLISIISYKLDSEEYIDLELLARDIGKFIINSLLVKTAVFGIDPNWGRIIAALGSSINHLHSTNTKLLEDLQHNFRPEHFELEICGQTIYKEGMPTNFEELELKSLMNGTRDIEINIYAHGKDSSPGVNFVRVLGNDLSYDYVKINAEYTT